MQAAWVLRPTTDQKCTSTRPVPPSQRALPAYLYNECLTARPRMHPGNLRTKHTLIGLSLYSSKEPIIVGPYIWDRVKRKGYVDLDLLYVRQCARHFILWFLLDISCFNDFYFQNDVCFHDINQYFADAQGKREGCSHHGN